MDYMIQEVFAVSTSMNDWPMWTLLISAAWVILAISKLKIHPFLALMSAAILVGLLSGPLPETSAENKGLFHDRVEIADSGSKEINLTHAVKWSLLGFGNTAGGIGLLIALAAIVGTCMMQSGAAEKIVRCLLSAFGEKNITSYLKLKQQELKDFNSKETFSKKELITEWEKTNTLDC